MLPLVDEFAEQAAPYSCPLLLSPPYIIPSSSYSASYSQSSLPRYLLDRILPPVPQPESKAHSSSKLDADGRAEETTADAETKSSASTFLGLPAMNLNANMNTAVDPRKWTWPGYLTFGKGQSKATGKESVDFRAPPDTKEEAAQAEDPSVPVVMQPPPEADPVYDGDSPSNAQVNPDDLAEAMSTIGVVLPPSQERERSPTPEPAPEVITLTFHLSPNEDLQTTTKRKISCLTVRHSSKNSSHAKSD